MIAALRRARRRRQGVTVVKQHGILTGRNLLGLLLLLRLLLLRLLRSCCGLTHDVRLSATTVCRCDHGVFGWSMEPFLGSCFATAANAGPMSGILLGGCGNTSMLGTGAVAWFLLGVELINPGLDVLLLLVLLLLLLLVLLLLLPLLFTTLLAAAATDGSTLARIAVGFTGVIFVPSLFDRFSFRLLLSADRSLL